MTSKSYSQKKGAENFLLYILLVLLFYPPFFRGLFFQNELIPTQIITSIVFIVYYLYNKRHDANRKISFIEIGLIGMVLIYTISTLTAVNINLSIQETLKYVNYLLILVLTKRLINNEERLRLALSTLVFSGVVVVFIGIGTALETFNYNGAFVDGMINSTLQYHNTFGAYCLAVLFLAYGLSANIQGKAKYIMSTATFILFLGFILSYSRGAWVLLPVVGFIYYMLISVEYKISFISHFVGNAVGLLLIIKKFNSILQSPNKSSGWLWIVIGIAASLVVSFLIEMLLKKLNLNKKVYNIIIPIIVILMPIGFLVMKDTLLGFLPSNLAQRIGSISLNAETVTERSVFYKDAMKIVKDYPVFGTGGGGWETIYKGYQSYAYWSNQAHNYFMQLWIEVGTVGIMAFGLILVMYIYSSIMDYRKCDDLQLRNVKVTIFTSVMAILLHSAIDFDLSLSAVAIVMWSLIGMHLAAINNEIVPKINIKLKGVNKISYIVVGLACILLITSSMGYIAMKLGDKGVAFVKSGQIEKGKEKFKAANTLQPFNEDYLVDYTNQLNTIARKNKDADEIKKSIELMNKAVELNRYDLKLLSIAIQFYAINGQIDECLEVMSQMEEYNPLTSVVYENKSGLLLSISNYYIKKNNLDKAKKLLTEIVDIEEKINGLNEEIRNSVEMNRMVKFVEVTPNTQKNIEKAKEILKGLEDRA